MPVDGLSFSSCGDLIPSGHIGFTVMGAISILRELPPSWCRCIPFCRSLLFRSKNLQKGVHHLCYSKLLFYYSISKTLYSRSGYWNIYCVVCVGSSWKFIFEIFAIMNAFCINIFMNRSIVFRDSWKVNIIGDEQQYQLVSTSTE